MGAAAATRARAGCAARPPFSKGGVIQPTSGEAWLHEIKHYRPKLEKRPPLNRVGRSFIIRPFPLAGTTNPARNDQTRVVPPKCAAYFLGYAK